MLKSDLVRRLMVQCAHLYERDIEKVVNAILEEIIEALRQGGRVELRGFGVLFVKRREARNGRNPRTGATVSVPVRALPAFRTGKEMRERLNRSK